MILQKNSSIVAPWLSLMGVFFLMGTGCMTKVERRGDDCMLTLESGDKIEMEWEVVYELRAPIPVFDDLNKLPLWHNRVLVGFVEQRCIVPRLKGKKMQVGVLEAQLYQALPPHPIQDPKQLVLPQGTQVTQVKVKEKWSMVAVQGDKVGYVATDTLIDRP